MQKLFSQRNNPPPVVFRRDLPEEVRTRILKVFQDRACEHPGGFHTLLEDVGRALFKRYGFLSQSGYIAAKRSDLPVLEHFYTCDLEKALDFVEACFQQRTYGGEQEGVDEINDIFRENGIAYALSPYVEKYVEKETWFFGNNRKGKIVEIQYPRVILRDQQYVHQNIVQPTLELLSDKKLQVASSEMLKAHIALRQGQFDDAITIAASSFESFLKTICKIKKWPYDPDRDTCSKLVSICRDHGLFPSFYTQNFEAVGTIRNKLGDAHGRGPNQPIEVFQEHAEHIVHVTSAHMLFLAKLAGMG